MNSQDLKKIIEALAPIVREYVDAKVSEVEARHEEKRETIDLDALAVKAAELIERPKDGESVTPDDVLPSLKEHAESLIHSLIQEVPLPADGKDGQDGKDGEKGEPGESVSIDEIREMVKAEVAAIPKPRDGRDGKDGRDATQQIDMDSVRRIMSAEAYAYCPSIEGDERSIRIHNKQADGAVVTQEINLPYMSYAGTWGAEEKYRLGDVVSHGGSMWHCEKACEGDRPGQSDSWKLCVKRGRDGK